MGNRWAGEFNIPGRFLPVKVYLRGDFFYVSGGIGEDSIDLEGKWGMQIAFLRLVECHFKLKAGLPNAC